MYEYSNETVSAKEQKRCKFEQLEAFVAICVKRFNAFAQLELIHSHTSNNVNISNEKINNLSIWHKQN